MRFLTLTTLTGATLMGGYHVQAAPAIYGDVNVAGVSIANLDQTSATRRLTRELQPKLRAPIKLAAGPKELQRKRSDVGLDLDIGWMLARAATGQKYVPLKLRLNRDAALQSLRRLAPEFQVPVRNAVPVENDGAVQVRAEQHGVELNLGGSLVRLQSVEQDAATSRIVLAVHRTQAKVTQEKLKGINAVLSTYTTRFNSGNIGRTTNMRLGIAAIDGRLLAPGEVFSLNGTVGERTAARGYKEAIIFENGKMVKGLGGGISQVTGTLFNAALLANLPIVTYRTHSRPVDYIPIGRDATVAWGQFDMKFKNDRQTPIYISYRISGHRATARIFGAKTNHDVSLSVTSKKIGAREITAQLYRTVRENGKVIAKKRIGNSHYKWKEDDPQE